MVQDGFTHGDLTAVLHENSMLSKQAAKVCPAACQQVHISTSPQHRTCGSRWRAMCMPNVSRSALKSERDT